ncbi:bifunctional riboflavin kinase/FAD synthetase [Thermocrinis sp.]|jgi:riboflavin kinase/FMN adenylyltransferase|uniref:bifunctional riboflavin kinase/FAD synthetase n=1 Tax=Thermocrinis sp. TaxID=2024383 RepID=UPI002639EE36|nr:bifunctional riboflavin kinase/FAD synthetase [Thermocrinis sp.]
MEKVVSLKVNSKCLKDLPCYERLEEEHAITVGVFDGVHLGHQYLLKKLIESAQRRGLKSCVLSFYPHPSKVLSPRQQPCELTDPLERAERILRLGIDRVVFINFDREFSRIRAEDFLKHVLFERLRCRYLLVGYDWRFGYRREGEVELAKEMGQRLGFEVETAEPFYKNGHIISSTYIRRLLHSGRLEEASEYLGENYWVKRKVVRGSGRGSSLGYPTANLGPSENLCLKEGVYAVRVNEQFLGVANYGFRPTFDGKTKVLEVHILDFEGNLRGERLKVEFLGFLREEKKFSSKDELIKQIERDIAIVKEKFGR